MPLLDRRPSRYEQILEVFDITSRGCILISIETDTSNNTTDIAQSMCGVLFTTLTNLSNTPPLPHRNGRLNPSRPIALSFLRISLPTL